VYFVQCSSIFILPFDPPICFTAENYCGCATWRCKYVICGKLENGAVGLENTIFFQPSAGFPNMMLGGFHFVQVTTRSGKYNQAIFREFASCLCILAATENQTLLLRLGDLVKHRMIRRSACKEAAAAQGFTILPLPGYSPDLDPIERLWQWMREDVTQNHC